MNTTLGWWSYEYCFPSGLVQYHRSQTDPDSVETTYSLGVGETWEDEINNIEEAQYNYHGNFGAKKPYGFQSTILPGDNELEFDFGFDSSNSNSKPYKSKTHTSKFAKINLKTGKHSSSYSSGSRSNKGSHTHSHGAYSYS